MHAGCQKEHIATLKASELDVTVDDVHARSSSYAASQ